MYIPERISCKVIASDVSKSSLIKIALDSISGKDRLLDIELKEMPSIDILHLDQTDVLFLLDPANITPKGIQALKIFLSYHDVKDASISSLTSKFEDTP